MLPLIVGALEDQSAAAEAEEDEIVDAAPLADFVADDGDETPDAETTATDADRQDAPAAN